MIKLRRREGPLLARLEPWQAGVFTFLIDFGAVSATRWVVEGLGLIPRHSFRLGDGIWLPFYAAFASYVLWDYEPSGRWYEGRPFRITLLVGGSMGGLLFHYQEVQRGVRTWDSAFAPGQVAHMVVFGPMVYWMGEMLIPLIVTKPTDRRAAQAKWLAFASLALYFASGVADEVTGNNKPFV